jgi:hypothetical protein
MSKTKGKGLPVNQFQDFLKNSYEQVATQKNNLHGYNRDNDLSGRRVQVYNNPTTNKTIVTHRGTSDLSDVATDLKLGLFPKGYYNSKRYLHSKDIQNKAESKYGAENVLTAGHSLGARLASDLGKNSSEVLTYQKPTIPRDVIFNKANKKETHVRAYNDPVSILSEFDPTTKIQFWPDTLNPIDAHNITNLDKLQNKNVGFLHKIQHKYIGIGLKKLNFKKALSNFDIEKICKNLNLKLVGVFMKDELPTKKILGNYIINLQNSNQDGSHWCAMILRANEAFYFDSFGMIPPKSVTKYLYKYYSAEKCFYNREIIQDLKSILCGFFSIGAIAYISTNKGPLTKLANKYISQFDDNTKLNDNILIGFFKNNLSS